MVANTSIKNHKPGSKIRVTQKARVFFTMLSYVSMGMPVTAEQISRETGIKVYTVGPRIIDLQKGFEYNGVTYYAVKHSETVNAAGNPCNAYTLTTVCPEIEAAEHVERLRKKAIRAVIEFRTAQRSAIRSLFDK